MSTPRRVADIRRGAGSSEPSFLTALGNTLYFSANDDSSGGELWKTDGTNTSRVADIGTGREWSSPENLTAVGNILYFTANDGITGQELWKTNGSTTSRVADIRPGNSDSSPSNLTAVGNTLYFWANDGITGHELWKTDGSTTSRIADISPGRASSQLSNFTAVGKTLYFINDKNDTIEGEIWKTDGTTTSLFYSRKYSTLSNLTSFRDIFYFSDTYGHALWKIDGSTTSYVLDQPGAYPIYSNLRDFTVAGTTLYFIAEDYDTGRELWKSDGITATRITDINPGPNSAFPLSERNSISPIRAIGNTLFFPANDGSRGIELWKTDGITTTLVADILPGSASSEPSDLTVAGNTLFFKASDGMNNWNLWKTDGITTTRVSTLALTEPQQQGDRDNKSIISIGQTLFFSAKDGSGEELWALDLAESSAPVITLTLSSPSVTEDGSTNLLYTFSRTGSNTSPLTVNYTVAGTATLGTDYSGIAATPAVKTVTFAANSSTATVSVDPTADTTIEANETVALTLATDTGYTIGTTAAVVGTILNDDLPLITLAVAPTTGVSEDGTTNLVYTFSRTGATTTALTVNYTVSGTATPGTDYTGIARGGSTKKVSFAAGSNTATVTVDPTADTTGESNETVALTLATGAGYTIGTTSAVSATILNDDLIGTNANDSLTGTTLDEVLFGAAGNDILQGGEGQDRLDGGPGSDVLTGGAGNDSFFFRPKQSLLPTPDRLTDFAIGADKLGLLSASGSPRPAPSAFSRASDNAATSLAALVAAVFSDANGATTGNQALASRSAALVVATAPAIAGTYLLINDAKAGFQASNDLVVNLTGLTGSFPALGSIPVSAWFL
ncbi:MAG: ELWxxDGT repeat protein [Cyanobacteriota bacterium]